MPAYQVKQPEFPTEYSAILKRINTINPSAYAKSRNFADGAITYLSPYISRGVISTKQVALSLKQRGFTWKQSEKLLQELAWRDYWQLQWQHYREGINSDLRQPQLKANRKAMPKAILDAATGIEVLDSAVDSLYQRGYVHNHARMYLASAACNLGQCHWHTAAQWMYYHLLDGDWASNALSWQWVVGANSAKRYYANQENLNTFFYSQQKNTFLDHPKELLEELDIPPVLQELAMPSLETAFPATPTLDWKPGLPCLLYTYYNIDPNWHAEANVNRVLLLEPSVFAKYPVAKRNIDFAIELGKNIPGLQVYVGEFSDFLTEFNPKEILYKEHPLNAHFRGTEESRDWMFNIRGPHSSFFKFWKKAQKELAQYGA